MVFFKDKNQTPYTVAQPDAFLSNRAIDRRNKNNIETTELDLPVDPAYIATLRANGAVVFHRTRWMNGVLVQMDSQTASTIANLGIVNKVELVAPGLRLSETSEPFVPPTTFQAIEVQESSSNIQNELLGVDKMHQEGIFGSGVWIAMFDDGFEGINVYQPFAHIFTDNRLVATKDFVGNTGNVFQYDDHGTHCFSTISANHPDFVGVAPEASFVLCVTEDLNSEYRIEEYNWLFAAEYVDSLGIDVINSSVGYYSFNDSNMDYVYSDMNGSSAVSSRAAQWLSERGVVVVASAGNEGSPSNPWKKVIAPADAEGVVAVGSVDSKGNRSGFSSMGPTSDGRLKPDVCAMGSLTAIFLKSGVISTGYGTSYSSPQIAGLAAGIIQVNPDWTSLEVISAIKRSASNSLNPDTLTGYGVPQYAKAVTGETLALSDILENKLTVYPNPFPDNKITIDFAGVKLKNTLQIDIVDAQGKVVFESKLQANNLPDNLEIEFDAVNKGMYYLILRNKKQVQTVKLVKI